MSDTFTRRELVELQAAYMDTYLRRIRDFAKKYVLPGLMEFAKKSPTAHEYYFPISLHEGSQFVEDLASEVSLLLPEFHVHCVINPIFPESMRDGFIVINWSTERDIK